MTDDLNPNEGFPIIPESDPKTLIKRLIITCERLRMGVPVVGQKLGGKSDGLARSIDELNMEEMTAANANPAYKPCTYVTVGRLKGSDERTVIIDLLTVLRKAPPVLRVRGGRKSDKHLLAELVAECLAQNIVVLAVEEGEFLTSAALSVLRDLMVDVKDADRRQDGQNGGATRGIGVFVVGAPPLRNILAADPEAGLRWTPPEEIGIVTPDLVPEVYVRWFPQFRAHIDRIGEDTWRGYIAMLVTQQRALPVGVLINHAKLYLDVLSGPQRLLHRAQATFDQATFEFTWRRACGDEFGRAA